MLQYDYRRLQGQPLVKYAITTVCLCVMIWFLAILVHSVAYRDASDAPAMLLVSPLAANLAEPFSQVIADGADGLPVKGARLKWLQGRLKRANHFVLNNDTIPLSYFEEKLAQLGHLDSLLQVADSSVSAVCIKEETILHPEQDRLNATVLASYPRSGNSWLRVLVEGMSGYGTSSMYCDRLLMGTFRWECERSNRFLMKLHYPHKLDTLAALEESESRWIRWQKYDQCIYLIRNPFDAFFSYFMFTMARGRHDLKQRDFPQHFLKIQHVRRMTQRYKTHWSYWQGDARIPSLVVRYEDLKVDPFGALLRVYLFLLPELGSSVEEQAMSSLDTVELPWHASDGTSAGCPLGLLGLTLDRVSLLGLYRRISCAIADDLTHSRGTVYQTNKYAVGYSMRYFHPKAIAYIKEELADLLAQFRYN
jgi:hypothetical protein